MERRRHYRVTAEFRREVEVEVKGSNGNWWEAHLVDISVGGAALVLEQAARYSMRRGEEVVLRFKSSRLNKDLEVPSKIYYVRSSTGPHRIGIGFDEWEDTRSKLGPRLRSLFNQRQAFRVDVDVGNPVEIKALLGEELPIVNGRARDFSILGVGMWVHHGDVEHFRMNLELTLEFQLPKSSAPFSIGAVVRHLGPEGPQRSVGMEIIPDARFKTESRKALRDFVMHRQLELRRKGVRGE
jgi:c-di-GMP-binding flagellar brake protein YcgR